MWFKSYGYKQNPFSVRENAEFVIDSGNSRKIIEHLYSNNIVLLYGPTGTGKTSTLLKTKNKIGGAAVRINGKIVSEQANLNFEKDYYKKAFRLFGFLKPRKGIYVFVDEVQSVPTHLLDQIEGFWNEGLVKGVVCASLSDVIENCSPSFLRRLGNNKLKTKNLTDEDCLQILTHRLGINEEEEKVFERKALQRIIAENKNIPSLILQECMDICLAINKHPDTLITEVEVLQYYEKKQNKPAQDKSTGIEQDKAADDYSALRRLVLDLKLNPNKQKDKLIALLYSGKGTTDELSKLMNAKAGTISKMLNRLMKENKADIIETAPRKKYGLALKYKQELANR